VAEYRDLLTSEESVASLDRALLLARNVASGRGTPNGKPWHAVMKDRAGPLADRRNAGSSVLRQKEVIRILSTMPQKLEETRKEVPEEQYSLLFDTLLLVFHHAYFALLPGIENGRKTLLVAFKQFAASLPRPQDEFQVLGLVEVEMGDLEAAVESFRASLAAAHSDEHDFITRVQIVWTTLMERRLFQDALECLLDVYPRTSRSDLNEVSAMLRETYREALRTRKTHRSRSRKGA